MPEKNNTYSPFWGLQILVTVLAVWIVFQIVHIETQDTETKAALERILPDARAAVDAKKKLLSLAEDLSRTSATDPAAAKILDDFKLRVKESPDASAEATRTTGK